MTLAIEMLQTAYIYGDTDIIPWHMLMHVALHGMQHQHRAEAAQMLTEYGQSPSDLDFIFLV